MTQYVSRRQRCWKLLKELDPEIELSEGHRADMLLDLAGLDKHEKIMVQASVNNARTFERIADALVLQHPRIHLKESRRTSTGKGTSSKVKAKEEKDSSGRGTKAKAKVTSTSLTSQMITTTMALMPWTKDQQRAMKMRITSVTMMPMEIQQQLT